MSNLSQDARRLISEARPDEDLGDDHRARLRRSVLKQVGVAAGVGGAVALSTASSTAAAGAGAATATGGGLLVKLVISAVIVSALGTGGGVYVWKQRQAPAPAPLVIQAPVLTAAPTAPMQPAPPEPVTQIEEARVDPPPSPSTRSAPRTSVATRQDTRPQPSLNKELETLRSAQVELSSGHPDRALALLDGHPSAGGALGEERRAARVVALCELGRVKEARAEANRFLRTSPRSPLAPRVRDACRGPK